jgi:hypothetical protein
MTGGLTGVVAAELTPAAAGVALRARRTWATTGARAVGLLRSGEHWMGAELTVADAELGVEYALYGTTGWERISFCDAAGERAARDLNLETGLSEQLIRVRWGGARHRNRYRWATWSGSVQVTGSTVDSVEPWAQANPEQRILAASDGASWRTTTYGGDTGVLLRIDDLAAAAFELNVRVAEDGLDRSLRISGRELIEVRRQETVLGGLDLHVCVERIAEPNALPASVIGTAAASVPAGESALYIRARQCDGHELWTSPLFLTRTETVHEEQNL